MGHRILYIPKPKSDFLNVDFGLLYNWFAAIDSRKISSSDDWRLLTYQEAGDFRTFWSNNNLLVKETGDIYWNTDNGLNSYNLNARGSGRRSPTTGDFLSLKLLWEIWTSTEYIYDTTQSWSKSFSDNQTFFSRDPRPKEEGLAIRLVNPNTSLSNGQSGTYTGNDGKIYRTICINNYEWIADNLLETKYRNGDLIPEVSDPSTWINLTTGALCSYNNDWNNA